MNNINKTAVLPYTQTQMFDLVSDINHYQDFLPWCSRTDIIKKTSNEVVATLYIEYLKVKTQFTTKNTINYPNEMLIELVDGPFKFLQGKWLFKALGENGCKVEFTLEYTFANFLLETMFGPVFKYITQSIMQAFINQAHIKYAKTNITH